MIKILVQTGFINYQFKWKKATLQILNNYGIKNHILYKAITYLNLMNK